MTATLYKWTDDGAPQFVDNNAESNWLILKAVLVDGYGSRTPVGGWTNPFSDPAGGSSSTGLYVLRSQVDGRCLQIDVSNNEMGLRARGFRSMSGVDTGTNPFPSVSQLATFWVPMRVSTSVSGNNNSAWYMIVDDAGEWFYFLTGGTQNTGSGWFFGKLDFPIEGQRRWVLNGIQNTPSTSFITRALFSTATTNYTDRDPTGVSAEGSVCTVESFDLAIDQPSFLTNNLYLEKIYLRTNTGSQFMGTYPNFVDCGSFNSFESLVTLDLDGKKYLQIDSSGGSRLFNYDSEVG